MSKEPEDVLGPLAQGAIATNELFKAYIAAGFTRREALHLVAEMSRELMRIAQGK